MKVPDESVSLPMVDRLKLTDAKGILSSLCESLTMPLMIFFCATPVLEVKKIKNTGVAHATKSSHEPRRELSR